MGRSSREAKRLGLSYERKLAWFPRSTRKEVIRLSGQTRVPVLADEDGTVLHESKDIVKYLQEKYEKS